MSWEAHQLRQILDRCGSSKAPPRNPNSLMGKGVWSWKKADGWLAEPTVVGFSQVKMIPSAKYTQRHTARLHTHARTQHNPHPHTCIHTQTHRHTDTLAGAALVGRLQLVRLFRSSCAGNVELCRKVYKLLGGIMKAWCS